MCGIAGKIYFNRSLISLQDIKQMTNAVAHRGPDDEGVYISPDKKAGLGISVCLLLTYRQPAINQ